MNNHELRTYIRNKPNRIHEFGPYRGVIVATSAYHIGWALCNPLDKFDKQKAVIIARKRAQAIDKIIKRSYFLEQFRANINKYVKDQKEIFKNTLNKRNDPTQEKALKLLKEELADAAGILLIGLFKDTSLPIPYSIIDSYIDMAIRATKYFK